MKLHKVSFEDALDMTGFGKFNILIFVLNLVVVTSMAFEVFSVSYLVPASACELKTSVYQQGLIAGMPLIGIIATSHIWGYLADTRGRRLILLWSLSLGFCAGALATVSPNWIALSVLKFLSSTALAGSYPLAITLLSESTPRHRRSIFVSFLNSQIFICCGIMAIVSIPVLHLQFSYRVPLLGISLESWRLLNMIFASPCLVGALGMFFAYESPRFLVRVGRAEEAVRVLRGIYALNSGNAPDDYMVQSVVLGEQQAAGGEGLWRSFAAQTVTLFKPPLLRSTLLLSLLFVICYFGMQPFLIWLPYMSDGFMRSLAAGGATSFCGRMQYAQNQTLEESSDCSLNQLAMTSVFTIYVFLSILNALLSAGINLIGKKRLLISFQLISGASALALNHVQQPALSAALFVLYVMSAINFSFLSIYTVDIYPTSVKAMAVCFTLMVGRGSSALGINLVKALLATRCDLAFYCFGALTLGGGLVAFLLPSDKKPKEIEDGGL